MAVALVLLLAVVQGIAEFLPISSSGHLRIFAEIFGIDEPQTLFDVMLHVGTLGAVLIVYRDRVKALIRAFARILTRGASRERWQEDADLRLLAFVIVATIPTGIIALTLGPLLEGWAASLAFVGAALLVNAVLLFVLGRLIQRPRAARGLEDMRLSDALFIGFVQGLAVTRGISRSGSTITAAVFVGLRQDAAASFSFLLSIPAILGALVLSLKDFDGEWKALVPGLIGALVAFGVGLVALKLLLRLLGRGRLGLFALWSLVAGAFALCWQAVH